MHTTAKKWLILVADDPRTSARPAEAIRIAAGVGAWKGVQPSLYFSGPAVRCLDLDAFHSIGAELLAQHLSAILAHGGKLFAEAKSPNLKEITTPHSFEAIDSQDFPGLISEFDYSTRF